MLPCGLGCFFLLGDSWRLPGDPGIPLLRACAEGALACGDVLSRTTSFIGKALLRMKLWAWLVLAEVPEQIAPR